MQGTQFPLELISNFLSIIILIVLFVKYYQYKKKLDVIKALNELKEQNSLTADDKEFIKTNYKYYKDNLQKDEERIKMSYPVFILIAGILVAFLSFSEAMIHLNVIVVAYIYLHVTRIHTRNFVGFLKELNNNDD